MADLSSLTPRRRRGGTAGSCRRGHQPRRSSAQFVKGEQGLPMWLAGSHVLSCRRQDAGEYREGEKFPRCDHRHVDVMSLASALPKMTSRSSYNTWHSVRTWRGLVHQQAAQKERGEIKGTVMRAISAGKHGNSTAVRRATASRSHAVSSSRLRVAARRGYYGVVPADDVHYYLDG